MPTGKLILATLCGTIILFMSCSLSGGDSYIKAYKRWGSSLEIWKKKTPKRYKETKLRKADHTVGVNCYIFSTILSGAA